MYSLCKATRLWTGEVQTAPYLLPWCKFTWLQFSGIPASLWQPRSHSLLVFYWKSKASTDQTKPVSSCLGEKMKKELDNKPDTTQYRTNSTTVLLYIKMIRNDFKFSLCPADRFSFLPRAVVLGRHTKENPANDGTQGLDAKMLTEQQHWLTGPEFLRQLGKAQPVQPLSQRNFNQRSGSQEKLISLLQWSLIQHP